MHINQANACNLFFGAALFVLLAGAAWAGIISADLLPALVNRLHGRRQRSFILARQPRFNLVFLLAFSIEP